MFAKIGELEIGRLVLLWISSSPVVFSCLDLFRLTGLSCVYKVYKHTFISLMLLTYVCLICVDTIKLYVMISMHELRIIKENQWIRS